MCQCPGLAASALWQLTARRKSWLAALERLGPALPTGVFASEMTVPYYAFLDAGMDVDLASPKGGLIPVDPMSLKRSCGSVIENLFW